MAKKVVCSPEALSDLLGSVNLDIYISQTNSNFEAKNRGDDETCYAFAIAAVIDMATKRIHGRQEGYPEFEEIKDNIISSYGRNRASTQLVLDDVLGDYRLHYTTVSCIEDAKKAISEKRPVIARLRLMQTEWDAFENFFATDPTGIYLRENILTLAGALVRYLLVP